MSKDLVKRYRATKNYFDVTVMHKAEDQPTLLPKQEWVNAMRELRHLEWRVVVSQPVPPPPEERRRGSVRGKRNYKYFVSGGLCSPPSAAITPFF